MSASAHIDEQAKDQGQSIGAALVLSQELQNRR